nr:MAG TPA: hypothetical protein [Caudoviricetes sp.]
MREFSTLFASFKSPRSSHSAVLCRSFLRRLLCTKILIFHTQTQTSVCMRGDRLHIPFFFLTILYHNIANIAGILRRLFPFFLNKKVM